MKIIHHTRTIAVAGALLFQGIAQGQIADGLLNYWDFDDNTLDTASTYPGSTGVTNNDGTINGDVTYVASKDAGFGKAASLTGVAGTNITVPDGTEGANDIDRTGSDLTISVWFQAASWTTGWQAILAHGEGQDYRIARSGTSSPAVFAAVAGTTDMQTGTTFGTAPDGDGLWHHIVVTGVNGAQASFYVDGVLEATSAGLADPTVSVAASGGNNNVLCIGCNPDNGREFHGLIDQGDQARERRRSR